MNQLDRGVMARVWGVLNARDAKPRPRTDGPGITAQAATGDTPAELLVYDEIGWFGICAADVVAALGSLGGSDVHVRVNSPGGDVFDGVAIYNALLAHPGNVTVTVEGLAASAASFIAMAGDSVTMSRASQMMIHDASGLAYGNAADMQQMAELLDKVSDMIAGIYADRAGGAVADWRDVMRAETWYAPAEAIAAGLADAMPPKKGAGQDDPDEDEDEDTSPDTGEGGESTSPDKTPGQGGDGGDTDQDTGQPRKPSMTAWDLTGFRYPGRDHAPAPLLDAAVGPHDTAVKDGAWDAGAEQKKLPSPMPVATAKKVYGAYDDDAVTDGQVNKTGCHLPHHFVSSDGTPGAASINGVRNALSRLPQTQGLSDDERATVEKHLNGHLNAYKGDEGSSDDNAWDDVVAHLMKSPDEDWARATEALK